MTDAKPDSEAQALSMPRKSGQERDARAAALRDNLRRRKQQARTRASLDASGSDAQQAERDDSGAPS